MIMKIICLIVYFAVGHKVIYEAWEDMRSGNIFNENFLMLLASVGAFAIGEPLEAIAVMVLFRLGEYLEERALDKSQRSVDALLKLQPETATILIDGHETTVDSREVEIGQTILVKPGECIPLDGEVLEGNADLDTSMLTGESFRRSIQAGASVQAGMINANGFLKVKVTKNYDDSSIQRILQLVCEADERKAPAEKFISVFARYYTPSVLCLAALIALLPPLLLTGADFKEWLYRALTLLVISCPCALVISVPLTYVSGLGLASRYGILVKGSNYLDELARVHTVVFDKTGTLTKGNFTVTEVVPRNDFTTEKLLKAAAAVESASNHPLALSLRQIYPDDVFQISDFSEIPGCGVRGTHESNVILAGNDRILHMHEIEHGDCDVSGTIVYVAINQTYAGYIVISDELKETAQKAVSTLRDLKVGKIYMLTGDDCLIARQVSDDLLLDGYFAELTPSAKSEQLELLRTLLPDSQRCKLAFVGDGINDAPVIAAADVGVAMGALGSDAAIESADVVLMDDNPEKIAEAIQISRYTRKVVFQNVIGILILKLIFIMLGLFNVANMWMAIFADVGVALLAIFNSMRVLRYKWA